LRAAIVVAALTLPSLAHAFADATQFFANAHLPHSATFGASGEGLYFTGSPHVASRVCADCHTGGPLTLGLKLGSDDTSLFDVGYTPGKVYHLQVELQNETEGLMYGGATCTDPPGPMDTYQYQQCNYNGFGLEIDGPGIGPPDMGSGTGVFCASAFNSDGSCPKPGATDESLVSPDGTAVFDNLPHSTDPYTPYLVLRNDPRIWDFWWKAPGPNSGPLTIYVAAVDGNGGSGTPSNDQDTAGDDTVQTTFFVQEAGASLPAGANAGCSVAARPITSIGLWMLGGLLLVTLLLLLARRSRRSY
jgi:hypothetical protein